jgi:HK97 family phage portal protein
MPLHKIQEMDKATFGNIEHQSIEYVIDTLLSWLVRWEQRLNRSLLTREERRVYFFEFLPDMLLRGTTKERYEAHRMAILDGWKTRNEVRAMENLNPADGLDEFLEPLNMVRASERAAA